MPRRITLPDQVHVDDLGGEILTTTRDRRLTFTAQAFVDELETEPQDLTNAAIADYIVFCTVDVDRDALRSLHGLNPVSAFSNIKTLPRVGDFQPVVLRSIVVDAEQGLRTVTLPSFLWPQPIEFDISEEVPFLVHIPYYTSLTEAYPLGRGGICLFEAAPESDTARTLT